MAAAETAKGKTKGTSRSARKKIAALTIQAAITITPLATTALLPLTTTVVSADAMAADTITPEPITYHGSNIAANTPGVLGNIAVFSNPNDIIALKSLS